MLNLKNFSEFPSFSKSFSTLRDFISQKYLTYVTL